MGLIFDEHRKLFEQESGKTKQDYPKVKQTGSLLKITNTKNPAGL
jgi:hypothetical protein